MDRVRNWNEVVDVTSFLLFESTGDSEATSDLNMDYNIGIPSGVDDAQSCSGLFRDFKDQEYRQCPKKQEQKYEKCHKKQEQEYVHDDYNPNYRYYNGADDEDDDDDDDGAIDQDSTCGKVGFVAASRKQKRKEKAKVYVEPVKKEEEDKLFWETCLASEQ